MNNFHRNLFVVIFLFTTTHPILSQWIQTNGPCGCDISCFTVSGPNLFAGSATWPTGGVFLSTDNGTSWATLNSGLTDPRVYCFAITPDGAGGTNLFAGGWGVYISTNNGASWNAAGPEYIDVTTPVFAFCVHPNGTRLFAAVNGGVFLSTDNGATWSETGLRPKVVKCLAFSTDKAGNTYLFGGTAWGEGVWCLTNNDTSWHTVNSNLTHQTVTALAVSGTNIYAGTLNTGVYLSSDNGASWSAVNSGLQNMSISAFAVYGTHIFAGTSGGVFLSSNNGTSWTAASSGLPNSDVRALAISGTHLFAGTNGNGIWKRPLSEMITSGAMPSVAVPVQFSLEQNFPNPFNPATTIVYRLPGACHVKLSVYDILGREVAMLVNEVKQPGTYTVTWDASGLPSGVYFYRMLAGAFIETKKVLLGK